MTSILWGHDVLTVGKFPRKFGHYSSSTTRKVLCFGKWFAFLVLLIFVFMFPHSKFCFFHKEGEFILLEGRFIKIPWLLCMVYIQTYKCTSLANHTALTVIGYVTSHLTPYVTNIQSMSTLYNLEIIIMYILQSD